MNGPPLIIWFHVLLRLGEPPEILPHAFNVLNEQIIYLTESGLIDVASQIVVGLNDDQSGLDYATMFFPSRTKFLLHGLDCRNECLTILELERWVRRNPGEFYILYLHTKGASRPGDTFHGYGATAPWRRTMMDDMVTHWTTCIGALATGSELVCSRFMRNKGQDFSQHIPCGNFLWVKASFLRILPSILNRARIRESGIKAYDSRYEAEVYWGNGPRLPIVSEVRPHGGNGIP